MSKESDISLVKSKYTHKLGPVGQWNECNHLYQARAYSSETGEVGEASRKMGYLCILRLETRQWKDRGEKLHGVGEAAV